MVTNEIRLQHAAKQSSTPTQTVIFQKKNSTCGQKFLWWLGWLLCIYLTKLHIFVHILKLNFTHLQKNPSYYNIQLQLLCGYSSGHTPCPQTW